MNICEQDLNIHPRNHVDHARCFEQGIPGRDGKDGTPGLDGEKVHYVAPSPTICLRGANLSSKGNDNFVYVQRVMQGATA